MASEFYLQFTSATPFRTLDGIPNAIWTYTLSWSEPASLGAFLGISGTNIGVRLGLEFSRRIKIQAPTTFPDIQPIQATKVEKPIQGDVQYVYREFQGAPESPVVFSFIAPSEQDTFCPVKLVHKLAVNLPWDALAFKIFEGGDIAFQQVISGPAVVCPATSGTGLLPYATELLGTYQPLIGWTGAFARDRLLLASLRATEAAFSELPRPFGSINEPIAILSPVGLVNLFREYFFEIDTFLGVPVGHIWLSPGGTVELIEVNTRKTTIEQTTEQSVETANKTESGLSQQDDLADAVKEDNQTNTKLGVTASEQAKFTPVIQANASESFSIENTLHTSQEESHKHSRTQSEKLSSEIRRNFKTTFRTVTETTDTTSQRYVVQNTTDKLVNYELRRKMRKVAVQVQHIGTRLCWQTYLDDPGRLLGMGAMAHVVLPSSTTAAMTPPDPLGPKETTFKATFPWMPLVDKGQDYPKADRRYRNKDDHPDTQNFKNIHIDDYGNTDHLYAEYSYTVAAPGHDYQLTGVRVNDVDSPAWLVPRVTDAGRGEFVLHLVSMAPQHADNGIVADLTLRWDPATDTPLEAFKQKLAAAQKADFANAIRDRLKLISNLKPRRSEDLRSEEKHLVYGTLIEKLTEKLSANLKHEVVAELVREIFDVDEMLYFVAPDYWKPRRQLPNDPGPVKYPPPDKPNDLNPVSLQNETVSGWYALGISNTNIDSQGNTVTEKRNDYLITEETQPAPMGSSLGWLIQIDSDQRRNEFLNAAWVKTVFPVRPGKELEALDFLKAADVEGEDGLSAPYTLQPGDPPSYQGKTIGEVLEILAEQLKASNTDMNNTLATEKVFEDGFDPLETGFRVAEPYQIFDQWIEVIPTDQVVAVDYDPTQHGA
jgi:hypothetical protein